MAHIGQPPPTVQTQILNPKSQLADLVAQIPPGRLTTFGALAEALGDRIAARWVATHLAELGPDCGLPLHRVVKATGGLARVGQFAIAQRERLNAEGVAVVDGRVDLDRRRFDEFDGPRPLAELRAMQQQIAEVVELTPWDQLPKLVAGVDVSYPKKGEGVACYALVEVDLGRLVWSTTIRRAVEFPYISSYLSFRELPLYLDLWDEATRTNHKAEIVLVDGTGTLHHRHAGIASHLGVAGGFPTVGVTKKLLYGKPATSMEAGPGPFEIQDGDKTIGAALRARPTIKKLLYVSPGHRTDIKLAVRLVRKLLRGHKLPEPLHWADKLSRAED